MTTERSMSVGGILAGLGFLLLVAGVGLMAGVPWAMILAGALMLGLALADALLDTLRGGK